MSDTENLSNKTYFSSNQLQSDKEPILSHLSDDAEDEIGGARARNKTDRVRQKKTLDDIHADKKGVAIPEEGSAANQSGRSPKDKGALKKVLLNLKSKRTLELDEVLESIPDAEEDDEDNNSEAEYKRMIDDPDNMPDLTKISIFDKRIPRYFLSFNNCVKFIKQNPSMLSIPTKYSVDKLMMLLDNEKLSTLEKVFTKYEDGLSISKFISLIISSIYHPPEERIDLVYGLVRLFKDIDINGDGTMEWGEFTQYLIESMVGDSGIAMGPSTGAKSGKDNQKVDYKTGLRIDETEKDVVNRAYNRKAKMYLPSGIHDLSAHQEPIKKIIAFDGGRKILILEENSKSIKFYDQKLKKICQVNTKDAFKKKKNTQVQQKTRKKEKVIKKSKEELPIIIDFAYSEIDQTLIAATSNKKLFFWEVKISKPSHALQIEKQFLDPNIKPCSAKFIYTFSSVLPITSVYYLKKLGLVVMVTSEIKLTILKFFKKFDIYNLQKIAQIDESSGSKIHQDVILCVVEAWKSGYLITGGLDGKIKVWDARGYAKLLSEGKSIGKASFKFLGDLSKSTTTESGGRAVSKLKSASHKKAVTQMTSLATANVTTNKRGIRKLCYSNALNGIVLSVGFSNSMEVWSPDTSLSKAYIGKLDGHTRVVQDVKFITGSLSCISIDEGFSIRVWDVRKLEIIHVIKEETKIGSTLVNCLEYLQHKDKFIVGGRRLTIYDNNQMKRRVKAHNDSVFPVKVLFNNYYHTFVVLTKHDIRIFDSLTGKLTQVFNNLFSPMLKGKIDLEELCDFCFDDKQRKVIICDTSGGLRVYNLSNGELVEEIQLPGSTGDDNSVNYHDTDPYQKFLQRKLDNLKEKLKTEGDDTVKSRINTGLKYKVKSKRQLDMDIRAIEGLIRGKTKKDKSRDPGITNMLLIHHPSILLTAKQSSIVQFYSYTTSNTVTVTTADPFKNTTLTAVGYKEESSDIPTHPQSSQNNLQIGPETLLHEPSMESIEASMSVPKKPEEPQSEQCQPLRQFKNGHMDSPITIMHIDNKCDFLYTGAVNGTVCQWDLQNSKLVYLYYEHEEEKEEEPEVDPYTGRKRLGKKKKAAPKPEVPDNVDCKVEAIQILWPFKVLCVGHSNGIIHFWGMGVGLTEEVKGSTLEGFRGGLGAHNDFDDYDDERTDSVQAQIGDNSPSRRGSYRNQNSGNLGNNGFNFEQEDYVIAPSDHNLTRNGQAPSEKYSTGKKVSFVGGSKERLETGGYSPINSYTSNLHGGGTPGPQNLLTNHSNPLNRQSLLKGQKKKRKDGAGRQLLLRISMTNLIPFVTNSIPFPTSFQLISFNPDNSGIALKNNIPGVRDYHSEVIKSFSKQSAGLDLEVANSGELVKFMNRDLKKRGKQALMERDVVEEDALVKAMTNAQKKRVSIIPGDVSPKNSQFSPPMASPRISGSRQNLRSPKASQMPLETPANPYEDKGFSSQLTKVAKMETQFKQEMKVLGGYIMSYDAAVDIKLNQEYKRGLNHEPSAYKKVWEQSMLQRLKQTKMPQKLLIITDSLGQISTLHLNPLLKYTMQFTTPEIAITSKYAYLSEEQLQPDAKHPYLYLPLSEDQPGLPYPLPINIKKLLMRRDNTNADTLSRKYLKEQKGDRADRVTLLTTSEVVCRDSWVAHKFFNSGHSIKGSLIVNADVDLQQMEGSKVSKASNGGSSGQRSGRGEFSGRSHLMSSSPRNRFGGAESPPREYRTLPKRKQSCNLVTWGEDKFLRIWSLKAKRSGLVLSTPRDAADGGSSSSRGGFTLKKSRYWKLVAEINLVSFQTSLAEINLNPPDYMPPKKRKELLEKKDEILEKMNKWNFRYDWLDDKIQELDEVFRNLEKLEKIDPSLRTLTQSDKDVETLRAEYLYRNYIKVQIKKLQKAKELQLRKEEKEMLKNRFLEDENNYEKEINELGFKQKKRIQRVYISKYAQEEERLTRAKIAESKKVKFSDETNEPKTKLGRAINSEFRKIEQHFERELTARKKSVREEKLLEAIKEAFGSKRQASKIFSNKNFSRSTSIKSKKSPNKLKTGLASNQDSEMQINIKVNGAPVLDFNKLIEKKSQGSSAHQTLQKHQKQHKLLKQQLHLQHQISIPSHEESPSKMKRKASLPKFKPIKTNKKKKMAEIEKQVRSRYANHGVYDFKMFTAFDKELRSSVLSTLKKVRAGKSSVKDLNSLPNNYNNSSIFSSSRMPQTVRGGGLYPNEVNKHNSSGNFSREVGLESKILEERLPSLEVETGQLSSLFSKLRSGKGLEGEEGQLKHLRSQLSAIDQDYSNSGIKAPEGREKGSHRESTALETQLRQLESHMRRGGSQELISAMYQNQADRVLPKLGKSRQNRSLVSLHGGAGSRRPKISHSSIKREFLKNEMMKHIYEKKRLKRAKNRRGKSDRFGFVVRYKDLNSDVK